MSAAVRVVRDEVDRLLAAVEGAPAALTAAGEALLAARRVFVLGAGRSGIALQMTAMRLMHLGMSVHVVGAATSPGVGQGDVLLVASGSGRTGNVVRSARAGVEHGAKVIAISTSEDSPLADLAEVTIVVPAAAKLDRSASASEQYAGTLFEQGAILLGDILFHHLWRASGRSADDLWPQHSNLE